ncbi:MAG TPA: hypothetical protein VF008_04550 [Niastella sp.]
MRIFYLTICYLLILFSLKAQTTSTDQQDLFGVSYSKKGKIVRMVTIRETPAALNGQSTGNFVNSALLPVYRGETVFVTGEEAYTSNGSLAKTLLKSAGVATLGYALGKNEFYSGKENPRHRTSRALIPAVSAGVAVSFHDVMKARGLPDAGLEYYLYNKEKKIVASGTKRITRQSRDKFAGFNLPIAISEDGFLQVVYKNKGKSHVLVNKLQVTFEQNNDYIPAKGSIANDLNLQNNAECMPDHECGTCDEGTECYNECVCHPSWCEPDDPDPCWIDPCICDPWGCGEDPGDPGDDPCDYDPYSCDCYSYADANPCECSIDCGPGPEDPPDPPVVDPCNQAMKNQATMASSFYNSRVAPIPKPFLSTLSTNPNEQVWTIQTDNTIGFYSPGSSNTAPLDFNHYTSAIGHTHPPSAIPAPSPRDIYTLNNVAQNTAVGATTDSYIYAADGSLYVLHVTDPSELSTFTSTYPKAGNLDAATNNFVTGTPLQLEMEKAINYYTSTGGLSYNAAYEKAFAYVLDQGNTGLTLMKMNPVTNQFEPMLVTGNFTNPAAPVYTQHPCN